MTAHARADKHQRIIEFAKMCHERFHALAGVIDVAIVDGFDGQVFPPGHGRHSVDLRTPRPAFLAVGEDDGIFIQDY